MIKVYIAACGDGSQQRDVREHAKRRLVPHPVLRLGEPPSTGNTRTDRCDPHVALMKVKNDKKKTGLTAPYGLTPW
jgi:hypothetical protein